MTCKQGIGLRAYGQNDPVVAYKQEGYEMFEQMIAAIQEETLRRLFLVRVQRKAPTAGGQAGAGGQGHRRVSAAATARSRSSPSRRAVKIGRNDPCPCGSGLKWKKCTCKEYHSEQQ